MVSLGLEGKVILVTGGSRGIGAAIVAFLKELGAKVAYTRASEVTSQPEGILAIQANVTDKAAMEQVVEKVESELGPIYGVVANAGITRDSFFHKMGPDKWQQVIDTNLTGIYNTVSPAFVKMRERTEGSIVCISSIIGERGGLGQVNYAATKGGVISFCKALALEGAAKNVRANAIAPGFIGTDMVNAIPDKVKDKIIAEIPMGRFGTPDEVAWAVAFLLSPVASGYTTGTVLSVNGAHHT